MSRLNMRDLQCSVDVDSKHPDGLLGQMIILGEGFMDALIMRFNFFLNSLISFNNCHQILQFLVVIKN